MNIKKSFVVIGAGELQIPLIQAAKSLDLHVIATDANPNAIGFSYADNSIIASTLDVQESLDKLIEYTVSTPCNIAGVATAGTDASQTVAKIAEHFSLPGHHMQAAINASNKAKMRIALQKENVPIPKYKIITNIDEAIEFFNMIQAPCVLKPTTNMGARGISLVNSLEELEQAFLLAQENNHTTIELLIEEYIDAHELSIDALVHNGMITITGIADRIIEYSPYFVETGHILPSSLSDEWIKRAVLTFRDAIKALGLTQGAAKADLKISKTNTWIIEVAARLSGGFMSSHTFPFATGIPLHEYMVRIALGEQLPELIPTKNLISVERSIVLPPGIIKKISIPENISQQQYIKYFSFRAKEGDIISPPKNNLDKQGNIIATAPTRELALRAINKALDTLKIEVDDTRDYSYILTQSNKNAKILLKSTCNVCRECDGLWCRGQIPGVGGIGTGEGFIQAYQRFRHIKLMPNYINETKNANTNIKLFNKELSMPVLTAPIGGAGINYNHAISELEFQRAFIKGAKQAGSLAFVPDPASDELFPDIAQSILENFGHAIVICKPRKNLEDIKKRYHIAMEAGVVGFGTDIDGIGLKTFTAQSTCTKNKVELSELANSYELPFVVKGVLSVQDALNAVEIGATHIVVSSHGGRIGESFPLPIDMLPKIKNAVGNKVTILVDGAIRSGSDVIKTLLLGADAVLIGRPVAIHAVGGGYEAVTAYLTSIKQQMQTQMTLLGVSSIDELKKNPQILLDYNSFFTKNTPF